jgi:hypothetical protein
VAITLVEFIAPLKKRSQRDQCLAVLYFVERYKDSKAQTSAEIRTTLGQARVPRAAKINVADVMARSGHYVDAPTSNEHGHKLWQLTDSGREYVRGILGLPQEQPEIEADVSALTTLAGSITDPVVRGFVDEAILCLRVGALRAAVVFLWTGAIRTIQDECMAHGAPALNTALTRHDSRAKHVGKIEDFASIKDSLTLLAARDLAIVDKGEWQTLDEALGLRNRCGHPTRYKPGIKKASSFIEDVLNIVF